MPFAGYDDFDDCVSQNSDKADPDAYCAVVKRKVEGSDALSDDEREAAESDDCPEDHVNVDGRCLPVEEVEDVPPSALDMSAPRVMADGELDTEPIEREELGDGLVAYRNLKLVDSGVWTDQNSKTPTLYDTRTFEATTPKYDSRQFDGPPVNIAHDIHKDGPNAGEPHEASIGGYIDPESVRESSGALFGDVILDTSKSAGAFADDNLRSALENDGTAGFSPSVELMPTDLRRATDHGQAEEYVAAAELTGLGLVRDPASKSVDLRSETQTRAVAMSASGKDAKVLTRERESMSDDDSTKELADAEELRQILDNYGFENLDEMDDEDVMEVASDLHADLMGEMESEMEEHADEEEEEDEEDDDKEMQDEALEGLREQIDDLWSEMEDLKSSMMSEAEMSAELEEAKAELAAADTVAELKEARDELDKRLSHIEEQEAGRKTLAESHTDEEWEPTYDDGPSVPNSW